MPISLTPRIYGRNFKWGILPSNKVDTVVMLPMLNIPSEETTSFTSEITSVNIKNVDGEITSTLPIANSVKSNRAAYTNNYEPDQPGMATMMCLNLVACVVATGSVLFELRSPLPTSPTAKLHCEGQTFYINRGSKTHGDIDNLWRNSSLHDVPQWIQDNASGKETWVDKSTDSVNRGMYDDPALIDYTGKSVPLYGWARKIKPGNAEYPYDDKPAEQDILTTWVDQDKSNNWAQLEHWNGYSNAEAVQMWPSKVVFKGKIKTTKIALINRTEPISAQVVKIDDYTYRVDYSIPVRYTYYASSQYFTSFLGVRTYHDLDNYCFMDNITKLQVELSAQEFSDEHVDLSYSLDNDNQLTTNAYNEHPLSFTSNEFITLGTYWGENTENLWTSEMSEYLLNKFKEGKYIIECEVPATWALQNNVHINSVFNIVLQDSTTISRGNVVCDFEVKNIEKIFKNNSFMYSLKLMEV